MSATVRDRDEGHGQRADRDLQGGDRLSRVPKFIVQREAGADLISIFFFFLSRGLSCLSACRSLFPSTLRY